MIQFEYKCVKAEELLSELDLKQLGLDGWELIQVVPNYDIRHVLYYYFKRPVKQ